MQSVELKYWHSLQSIQGVKEVEGTPNAISLQGLQNITAYRCQAVWKDNGTPFAESNTAAFTTLPAGSISLTLHNISRENYNYRVHYLFSSTYTLSSAVLSCNGQTFTGTVSGNTITFIVTGLTAGDSYLYQVTAEDIYQESATANGTIVTTIVNEVNMYYNSRSETSVTFDLSYLHDFTFRGGWVNVWNSTQDPSTDTPITHEAWFDGDTQVTVPALAAETTYKFRAGMTVEDAFGSQTTVYSSVVTATTAEHDYSNDYFTIKNETSAANNITITPVCTKPQSNWTFEGYYSNDNGNTWTRVSARSAYSETITIPMRANASILLKRSGGALGKLEGGQSTYYFYTTITAQNRFSVAGNIKSLLNGDPTAQYNIPSYAALRLFEGATTLISAKNLNLGDRMVANQMTYSSFSGMFSGCTSLADSPAIKHENIGEKTYSEMFKGCTSLRVAPKIESKYGNIRGGYVFSQMFIGCTNLVEAVFPNPGAYFSNNTYHWLESVAASGTLYADYEIEPNIPTDSSSGCPAGWNLEPMS